jgi:DNA-binding transcriptional LysR family regulator
MSSSTGVAAPPWLTQEEIDDLCHPLKTPAAQIRYLQREGLLVTRKPGGRALVMRSELERVKGAARLGDGAATPPEQNGPNIRGMQQWRERKNGAQAKGR